MNMLTVGKRALYSNLLCSLGGSAPHTPRVWPASTNYKIWGRISLFWVPGTSGCLCGHEEVIGLLWEIFLGSCGFLCGHGVVIGLAMGTYTVSLGVFGWSWGSHKLVMVTFSRSLGLFQGSRGSHSVVMGTFPGSLWVFWWSWGRHRVATATCPVSLRCLGGHSEVPAKNGYIKQICFIFNLHFW